MSMLSFMTLAGLASCAAMVTMGALSGAAAGPRDGERRVTGPFVHDNLAVYLVHGSSAPGPIPLTLAEALETGAAKVLETGNVNALELENLGAEEIFIQAGDIVKGGRQDRVLTVSLVVPPRSGRVPISAYCVESGRWAARGAEDVARFASAKEYMPSRAAKLAINRRAAEGESFWAGRRARVPSYTEEGERAIAQQQRGGGDASRGANQQGEVWGEVAKTQAKLAAGLGLASVAAPESASSLQLTLENEKLAKARAAYKAALDGAAAGKTDAVGLVFAVDGKINSADVYPSAGLFQKMWPKLLDAAITEAIGERGGTRPTSQTTPDAAAVLAFLAAAEAPDAHDEPVGKLMRRAVRDSDAVLTVEARREKGDFVHRTYLAK